MSYTHSISYLWGNGSQSLSSVVSQTADSESSFDIVAPPTVTNTTVALNFGSSTNVKSLYFTSDQTATSTFTVSGGTNLVVSLGPTSPFQWITGNGLNNPFYAGTNTATITACTVSNTNAVAANIKFRFLISA